MGRMDIKSALVGAGVVVATAVGGVLAISAVNAQEPPVTEPVGVEDTYTGPYVYWEAPEPLPHITVPPKPVEQATQEEDSAMPEESNEPAPAAEDPAPQPKREEVQIVESDEGPGEPPIVVRPDDDPPPLDPGPGDSAPLP